ncbi:MAG: methyltransferase domain-containing protein [Tagaea sp.]|nr:methyltransferase domain-containing protein [Tagaea sp.]
MSAARREFEAYQAFVLDTKLYWTSLMFGALKAEYEAHLPRAAKMLDEEPLARWHAWFERHLQRMKYSGRLGLVPYAETLRAGIERDLDAPLPDGLLELDPALAMPRYYSELDVHQHPGGVWSDPIAGAVYEMGARSTTPLLTKHKDLHQRLVDLILARATPKRVLDLGCGFGKTTKPLYESARDAEVIGLDLSAPCLKFAAQDAARAQARNVRFVQRDAARTGLAEGSVDVVTSTMLLHEMPPAQVRATLAEAHRVLAPGGWMVHLDFLPPDDEFLAWLHAGHAKRNNEPYMATLAAMDIGGAIAAAGFDGVEISEFEEAPGALALAGKKWRFPWTLIAARKAA